MASQAVTKVEMVKILKEAFVGFRKTTKGDMDMGFAGFRKTTKGDMDMGFAGFRKTTKGDMDMGFAGFRKTTNDDMDKSLASFREVVRGDMTELIRTEVPKILAVEVPKILLDFHAKVEEPMTEEILSRLDSVEGRIGLMERKLDKVTDHQAEVLDNHEERIGRIEAIV